MYNERQDNFSVKDVILQILFVILFVFILMWLFPSKQFVKDSLEPLYDRIFNENILIMKDAAKGYYTTPRLPQNVGDKVSMTLGEMLNKKLLIEFKDSSGKKCDHDASYVEITKYDEEFVMKVNLKCSKQENYILVYMGCYDYCKTTICEKEQSDVKTPVIRPTNPVITVNKPTPTSNPKPTPTNNPKPTPTPSPVYDFAVLSGSSFGNSITLEKRTSNSAMIQGSGGRSASGTVVVTGKFNANQQYSVSLKNNSGIDSFVSILQTDVTTSSEDSQHITFIPKQEITQVFLSIQITNPCCGELVEITLQ